jgi:hypothetical protein
MHVNTCLVPCPSRSWQLAAAFIAVALVLGACVEVEPSMPRSSIVTAAVEDDYNTARARLATMLAALQSVEGLVPSEAIASAAATLDTALENIEKSRAALDHGQPAQAIANLTAANLIMDGLEMAIASLLDQADASRQATLGATIAGIGIACAVVACLLVLKQRRDKRKQREFLDATIDYSGFDAAGKKG